MQIDELPRLSDEEATHAAACDLDREATGPTDLPDGFPTISDVHLAKLIGEAQDKTLHSALTELHLRRGDAPRTVTEPALYTLGLSPMELLGHLRKELLTVQSNVHQADSVISVAGLALRHMDCDQDGDVADVLESHAWPELKEAHQALETAEQLLIRLEQLSQKSFALSAAFQEVFHG